MCTSERKHKRQPWKEDKQANVTEVVKMSKIIREFRLVGELKESFFNLRGDLIDCVRLKLIAN